MTLQEAAAHLDLHYMTVYRYVRLGRLPATRQGTGWLVRTADVERLRAAPPRRPRGITRATLDGLAERMLAGDNAGAWWLIENRLAGGAEPTLVMTDLIVPVLRSIGDRWASGELSVADEHRASAVAQRLVGRLGLQFGTRGKTRGTVALAAPAGDFHTLPVAIAADLLRWRGLDVLELGGNTPAEALGDCVIGVERLLAVGIVATTPGLDDAVAASVAAVHRAAPAIPIVVGGQAVPDAARARALGADEWSGPDIHAALDTIERLAGPACRTAGRPPGPA
jgi:excisionase family DNA binding protein